MLSVGARSLGALALLSVGLLGASCSEAGRLSPVRGKVVYKGEPLAGALVTFHPKGDATPKTVPSTGLTKDDGTFALTTGDRDGAPPGDYVVTVLCSEPVAGKKGAFSTGPADTKDRLQGAYSNRATSKMAVTVKAGENQLDPFDLK